MLFKAFRYVMPPADPHHFSLAILDLLIWPGVSSVCPSHPTRGCPTPCGPELLLQTPVPKDGWCPCWLCTPDYLCLPGMFAWRLPIFWNPISSSSFNSIPYFLTRLKNTPWVLSCLVHCFLQNHSYFHEWILKSENRSHVLFLSKPQNTNLLFEAPIDCSVHLKRLCF